MHKQYPAWARSPISPMHVHRWKQLERPHPLAKQEAPTKCAMATFSLCSNVVTRLLTGMYVKCMNIKCMNVKCAMATFSICSNIATRLLIGMNV